MSERQDEKWLDNQLRRAVDGTTPVFDAEAWKHKHAQEFQTLLRRKGSPDRAVGWGLPHRFLVSRWLWWGKPHPTAGLLRGSFAKVTLAAAITVAAGVFLVGRFALTPEEPTARPQPGPQQSPAQMVSMISLSAAFQRGGIDELNKQCDRALERLGPRPTSVSMQELLKDINSKG